MSSRPKFGQANFFRLCNWLQGNKDAILAQKPGLQELQKMVSDAIKLTPPLPTLSEAREVVGLKYTSKSAGRSLDKPGRFTKVVAKHLANLMLKIGEQVPQDLVDIINS